MKKVYASALILFCMPSIFGQQVGKTYNFGTKEKITSPISGPKKAVEAANVAQKGSSEKLLNVVWTENFGTATSSADVLTTSNGSWVQNLNPTDSTYWSLRNTHPLSNFGFTDQLNGAFLSWDSYGPLGPVEEANNTFSTTPVKGSVISPAIDLSGVTGGIMMTFKTEAIYCCHVDSLPFKVSISEDGGATWSAPITLDFGVSRNQYTGDIAEPLPFTLDLSDYTSAHSANTHLKFLWDDGSIPDQNGQLNTHYFWSIDDIQLYEKPQHDLVLLNLWLGNILTEYEYTSIPQDFAGTLTVQAKVRNLGASIPTNAKLQVTVTGPGGVNDTYSGGSYSNGLAAEYDTITFVTPIDLSTYAVGTYQVKGKLIFTEVDQDTTNNSFSRTLKVTNGIFGQRDWEQPLYRGNIGKDESQVDGEAKPMGFGSVFYVPQNATLQGINLKTSNSTGYPTTVGGELTVDLYTYDPSNVVDFQSFQDAHPIFAGSWIFDITSSLVSTSNTNGFVKDVTLNFNQTDLGPSNLLGGKYYIALVQHAGGTDNFFSYLENPFDYDNSTHIYGPFADATGDFWFIAGTQIFTELNFDKSLSTNTLENDITVGFIAPNPTSGETTVGFSINKAQDATIEVIDLTGKCVFSKVEKGLTAGSHFSSFDASGLASGVYCVNIKTDNAISTQKFIKK